MTNKEVDVSKILFLLIIVYGLSVCFRVYGIDERYVSYINELFAIFFIVIVSLIIWFIFKWAVSLLLDWFDSDIDDGTKSSAYPLTVLLGGIMLAMAATYLILTILKVQSTVAMLSASILGFGVSFGAQSTLSQFFSGLMLLITRPFKVGDVVYVNNNGVRLIVKKIGVMTTIFQEWESETQYTMPNNKVSQADIHNVTSNKGIYVVQMYLVLSFDVDYQKARKAIVEAVNKNIHVLVGKPGCETSVEVDSFKDNAVSVKVTAYIDDCMASGLITSELREAIIQAFRDNDIPLNHRANTNIFVKELCVSDVDAFNKGKE